jgi:hypothetical protein
MGNSLLKYLQFILLFLYAGNIFSQSPDTVIVYEYLHVTDTIWLESKPESQESFYKRLNSLEEVNLILPTQNIPTDLKNISNHESATISINNILLSENNNKTESMKKITLFGLTLFMIHSTPYAQENIEKSIGFHIKANTAYQPRYYPAISWYKYTQRNETASTFEVTPSFGIKGNFPVSSKFSFSPQLNYLQLFGMENDHSMGIKEVNGVKVNIISSGNSPTTDLIKNGYTTIIKLYSEMPSSKFHLLSTDLLLNYYFLQGKKIDGRFFGGLRADFVLKQWIKSGYEESVNTDNRKIIFNYEGGLGFDLKKKVYFEIEFSGNINRFIKNDDLHMGYYITSINLGYYLFRLKADKKNQL